jgi:predicted dehydrogenase
VIDVAVVGLGKMGLSHLSMIKAHPEVNLVGVCDATGYLLDILSKYTGVATYKDLGKMLDEAARSHHRRDADASARRDDP